MARKSDFRRKAKACAWLAQRAHDPGVKARYAISSRTSGRLWQRAPQRVLAVPPYRRPILAGNWRRAERTNKSRPTLSYSSGTSKRPIVAPKRHAAIGAFIVARPAAFNHAFPSRRWTFVEVPQRIDNLIKFHRLLRSRRAPQSGLRFHSTCVGRPGG
jgi:hypothetical protein